MRRSTRVHRDRLPLACGNSGLRPGYSPVAFGLALVDDGGTSDLAGWPTSAPARPHAAEAHPECMPNTCRVCPSTTRRCGALGGGLGPDQGSVAGQRGGHRSAVRSACDEAAQGGAQAMKTADGSEPDRADTSGAH